MQETILLYIAVSFCSMPQKGIYTLNLAEATVMKQAYSNSSHHTASVKLAGLKTFLCAAPQQQTATGSLHFNFQVLARIPKEARPLRTTSFLSRWRDLEHFCVLLRSSRLPPAVCILIFKSSPGYQKKPGPYGRRLSFPAGGTWNIFVCCSAAADCHQQSAF